MRCVLFTLYGPLSSWGSIAVGEIRRTWGRPSKSGVLGLVAACLGIDRADEAAHAALERDWALSLRVDAPGWGLLDYHTVQYPPAKGKRTFATRRDELVQMLAAGEQPDTKVLSRREYLQDALSTVCLHPRVENPRHSAEDITAALLAPFYTPYLGRRSCPAALPFTPQIAEADDAEAALRQRSVPKELARLLADSCDAYLECNAPPSGDAEIVERRDAIRSRSAWQFDLRREERRVLPRAETTVFLEKKKEDGEAQA